MLMCTRPVLYCYCTLLYIKGKTVVGTGQLKKTMFLELTSVNQTK